MNVLSPKSQFQRHEDINRELKKVVESDNFHFAVSFALSEFVSTRTPSADQLSAVRTFIEVLLSLPLKEEPPRSMPAKTLDQSAYQPIRKEFQTK